MVLHINSMYYDSDGLDMTRQAFRNVVFGDLNIPQVLKNQGTILSRSFAHSVYILV